MFLCTLRILSPISEIISCFVYSIHTDKMSVGCARQYTFISKIVVCNTHVPCSCAGCFGGGVSCHTCTRQEHAHNPYPLRRFPEKGGLPASACWERPPDLLLNMIHMISEAQKPSHALCVCAFHFSSLQAIFSLCCLGPQTYYLMYLIQISTSG